MQILDMIKRIEGIKELNIVRNNSNPYRILLKNDTLSAYYFSVPIYRESDKKLVKLCWQKEKGKDVFYGINATVSVQENEVTLKNYYGQARITCSDEIEIEPTLNGIAVRSISGKIVFNIILDRDFSVRENEKYFALMKDEFEPFLIVNGLYAKANDKMVPLKITAIKRDNLEYELTVEGYSKGISQMLFEIDLYSGKFIFDTTVESKNPDANNAFGGVAFLGETEEYGEQWLYTRFDPIQLIDLREYQIKEANLYLPKYNDGNSFLDSHKMPISWCSFGTTWNTKNVFSEFMYVVRRSKKYEIVEVTDVVSDILRQDEPTNAGIVIKCHNTSGSTIVSTGDNYLFPQILAIKFQNN